MGLKQSSRREREWREGRADSLERQRTTHSYNQNDLQGAIRDPNPQTLYPNLGDSGYTTLSPPNAATGFGNHNAGPAHFNTGYINNHIGAQPPSQLPTNLPFQGLEQQFQPSAPPVETSFTKSRSRSRQRGNSPTNDDITCRTCGNMYGDKIYQCTQGHSSCSACKARQAACAQCRHQLTSRRNFDLEKYVAEKLRQRRVKCPNSADRCCIYIKIADMETHTKECPFKELPCPSLEHCTWAGTKQSAAKWDYEIHVYNKSQPRRKCTYTDRCAPSSESIEDIFESSKCAVIPQKYAKTFICRGTVTYKFFIKRDDNIKKAKEGVNSK